MLYWSERLHYHQSAQVSDHIRRNQTISRMHILAGCGQYPSCRQGHWSSRAIAADKDLSQHARKQRCKRQQTPSCGCHGEDTQTDVCVSSRTARQMGHAQYIRQPMEISGLRYHLVQSQGQLADAAHCSIASPPFLFLFFMFYYYYYYYFFLPPCSLSTHH